MSSNNMNKLAVVAAAVLMVVAGGATLYFKARADAMQNAPESDPGKQATVIDVHRVEARQHPLRFEVRGVLEGIREVVVAAEVAGLAVSRPIQEGQVVRPGDLLCRIDPTFHRLAKEEAEARLKGAAADLATAEAWLSKVRELPVDLKTELELKQRRADRDRALASKDLAAAQVQQAKERLARCTIVSPISGTINQVFYDEGELLSTMSPVAEIIDLSTMKLIVDLTELKAAHLNTKARVTITSSAEPALAFNGEILSVYPKASPSTRRVPVEIWINNEGGKLRSGSFVNCVIETDSTTPKLLVPAMAILYDYGRNYCYVAETQDDRQVVRRRTVETAPLPGSVRLVEITSGLQEGDLLILNKHREITHDQEVSPRVVSSAQGLGLANPNEP